MSKDEDVLKNTPEYESYCDNEAILTIEEKRELGLLKCSGCCSKKDKCCNKK